MKNRMEEYWALVGEVSQQPEALSGSVERARRRARKSRLRRFAAPAVSLAGLAACFVLLVNIFPTFALACAGVPLIRELTAAVAFSPSLSAAVAHDYVQYIGKTQTIAGVTVRMEYAIVDPVQAVFFYSVDGGRFYASPELTDVEGQPIGGYSASTFTRAEQPEGLESMTLSFAGGENSLPERFTMELYFQPRPEQDQQSEPAAPSAATGEDEAEFIDPRNDPNALHFTFDIALDPARINSGRTVEVGQWLELDGQRILIDRLELLPTRTVLYLDEDPDNTAWLRSLKFWFEGQEDTDGHRHTTVEEGMDGKGEVFDNIDGTLSASGKEGSKSYLTYYFQSFYYNEPECLSLHIGRAQWLDKGASRVTLDLVTGQCRGLPEGVAVRDITRNGDNVTVQLTAPLRYDGLGQLFLGSYWDPEGGEHSFNQWSSATEFNDAGEETGKFETVYLTDYPWDTVEAELSYTSVEDYEQPVSVPLF